MIVVRELDDPGFALGGTVVTIGTFDGLHPGHLRLIRRACARAREERRVSVVVSFDRHPLRVLAPARVPPLLTSPRQRERVLEAEGVGVLYLLNFDAQRASQLPDDFVVDVLGARLGARHVVVGENFTFGRGAAGTARDLVRLGRSLGFSVTVERLLDEGGTPVSSSRIRASIARGALDEARELLGRPFALEGVVVSGDGRGRALGYPTANLVTSGSYVSPPDGVYAGWANVGAQWYLAAISIGSRPTFYPCGGPRLLEVHLLDVDVDLYGRSLEVAFHSRIREQRVFDDASGLVEQMGRDVLDVRTRVGAKASPWAVG